jgi:hypothetical protein|tara:strand:+ start:443 stop:772 length:330 start_codon:yes stop_codon:yes gene_type:complete
MAKKLKRDSISRSNKDRFFSGVVDAGFTPEQLKLIASQLHEVTREKGTRVSSHRAIIADHPDFKEAFETMLVSMTALNDLLKSKKFKLKKRGTEDKGLPYVDVKVSILV